MTANGLQSNGQEEQAREGRDGRIIKTSNIGRSKVNGIFRPIRQPLPRREPQARSRQMLYRTWKSPTSQPRTEEIAEEHEQAKAQTEDELNDEDWLETLPLTEKLEVAYSSRYSKLTLCSGGTRKRLARRSKSSLRGLGTSGTTDHTAASSEDSCVSTRPRTGMRALAKEVAAEPALPDGSKPHARTARGSATRSTISKRRNDQYRKTSCGTAWRSLSSKPSIGTACESRSGGRASVCG